MKIFYWSLVLMMLLPSMAYTQNTEKENEFSMSMQIRPRAEYRNGAWFPRNEGVLKKRIMSYIYDFMICYFFLWCKDKEFHWW